VPSLKMYEGGRPRQVRTGISARFVDHDAATHATRALQKTLGLRSEQVSVALASGVDPNEIEGRGGYIGITKAGAVLVHARGYDPSLTDQVRELLERAGGVLIVTEHGTVSTGGYGPTTANGTRGVFGGAPGTSSMANHLFTVAPEPSEGGETK
jgi:hypothetical protein